MMFEHDDWRDFQSLATLCRKAGVARDRIGMVVAKELVDNALDASAACRVGLLEGNGFAVSDDGPGIDGDDRAIASLFSLNRPLRSSKRLRLPTRGALGNGLRVVAGAVYSTGGSLLVATRGRTLRLIPGESGGTSAEQLGGAERPGTHLNVWLGPSVAVDDSTLVWAREAIRLAAGGPRYAGRSSPWWFDSDAFFRLLHDFGDATVREVVAEFEGCTGPKAGRIAAPFGKGRPARDLDRAEADGLLLAVRESSRPVKPERLGSVGPGPAFPAPHKARPGTFEVVPGVGGHGAVIPFVAEASACRSRDPSRPVVAFSVNRTPIAAEIKSDHYPGKGTMNVFGCGLGHAFKVGRDPIDVRVNLDTPYMPIVSDGKAPDLTPFLDTLADLLESVGKSARRQLPSARSNGPCTPEQVIRANLDAAIAKASGDGSTRYSLRQLYYALRPHLIGATGAEPGYKTFCGIITRIERRNGADLPGIYRDARGTLYHPHTGEEIALGTLSVERYARPAWTFNKVLYCEKEGFFPILRHARWPERHDCAC